MRKNLINYDFHHQIVEQEQDAKQRADYDKGLSQVLTKEFGRGFSIDNIENMHLFYLVYGKSETVSRIADSTKSQTLSANFKKTLKKQPTASTVFNLNWRQYLT